MDKAGQRLLQLLNQLGFPPEMKIDENSPVENYFNIIRLFENLPDKYAIMLINRRAVALNLSQSKENLVKMIEDFTLVLPSDTEYKEPVQ